MTQPHHHVFNSLSSVITKSYKITEATLQDLKNKNVVSEADIPRLKSRNGMKKLEGLLRNRSFETFLGFVECIFLAHGESSDKDIPVINSIIKAVEEFDQQSSISHKYADDIKAIQKKYSQVADPEVEDSPESDDMPPSLSEATKTFTSG